MAHHALVSVQGDGRLHCCITQAQLQRWVLAFQQKALASSCQQRPCVIGIALPSCSIEESAVVLALAQSQAAVYVPIDMSLPVTRQIFMLQDARVHRLVTSPDSAIAQVVRLHQPQQLPVLDQALQPLVLVTNVGDSLKHAASSTASDPSGPADSLLQGALYIMYTSGSTGKPKGVVGTRVGAWNRLRWMWTKYPFKAGTSERVLRVTKLSFVDSVWEILGALEQQIPLVHIRNASGESVILRDRSAFLLVMQRWKISRLTVIPSVLELLVRPSQEVTAIASTLGTAAATYLRYLLISGEPLPLNVLLACSRMLPKATLLNLYGSTEVSGDITWAEFRAPISSTDLALWSKHGVPIGRRRDLSIGDASLMLVNGDDDSLVLHDPRDHTLVDYERPFKGELLVKSRGVTSGYVSTDLSSDCDWFRMGDTCQALGEYLFFCGRNDVQVKIRGIRLDLHAVECALSAVLRENSESAFAENHVAVIAVKDASVYALEHQRLVAIILTSWIDSSQEHDDFHCWEYLDAHSIKQRVRAEYGNAYVPDDILLIDRQLVKRLPQGKLDKRALEAQYWELVQRKPQVTQQPAAAIQQPVASSMRQFLLEHVKHVLRLDHYNAEELSNIPTRSFFELGGNSMLATLLCWDVKDKFNVVIPPDQMLNVRLDTLLSKRSSQAQPPGHKSSHQLPVTLNEADSKALPIEPPSKRQSRETTQARSEPHSRLWSIGRFNQTTLSTAAYVPTCDVANTRSQSLSLAFAWKVDLGKCIDASPLVIQRETGRSISAWAIVGSHSARIACIDVNSGVTIWHRELDDRIEACAALSVKNEFIYVGTYSGALYALSVMNGNMQWCFGAGGLIKSTALVIDCYQLVVCGAYNHVLYGLDSLTGAERWSHDMRGSVFSTPIFVTGSTNHIFSASTSGYVCSLAVAESKLVNTIWESQLPAPVFASLNVDVSTQLLLVGCADGNIYGLDLLLGTIQWKTPTQKPIFSSPCVYQSGNMIVGSHDGFLRKIDTASGQLVWSADLSSPIFASPAVVRIEKQDRLACCVATVSGDIFFLDERTGAVTLKVNSNEGTFKEPMPGNLGEIFASPVIIDQYCLVATRSNYLYAFHLTQTQDAKVPTN